MSSRAWRMFRSAGRTVRQGQAIRSVAVASLCVNLRALVMKNVCARRILSTLGRRAYRRPLTEADVQTLLSVYRAGRQGRDFDAGIEWALERILASPEFLFRIERDPENVRPGAPYQISDLELASRLSFFLWSSIPDDELLDLAVRGTLSEPSILEQQVRRMLNDDRATALCEQFCRPVVVPAKHAARGAERHTVSGV